MGTLQPRNTVTVLKALTAYFNVDAGKVPMTAWRDELKELTDDEKRELALGVCAITGDTLISK
jgi:hypothetical protein